MRPFCALALLTVVGCIDAEPSTDEVTLEITPSELRVTVENGAPVVQDVTVTLINANGTRTDVTARAKLALENKAFGTAHDGRVELTGESVGPTSIRATLGDWTTSAPVYVSSRTSRFAPGVTKAMRAVFDAAGERTGCGLSIAYPSRDAVIPRGAGAFDVQWTDELHDMFEVQLATTYRDVRVYTTGDLVTAMSAEDWQSITAENDHIELRVRGIVRTDAQKACTYSQPVRVSDEPMRGAIYLWGEGTGIVRQDVSSPTAEMTGIYVAPTTTTLYQTTVRDFPLACEGCALSKNGARLAVPAAELGYGMIYDFVNHARIVPTENGGWDSATFAPDDSRLVISQEGALHLITDRGQHLATFASDASATDPSISPDGAWLAYVADGSALTMRRFDTHATRTAAIVPAQDGVSISAPAWSPDGAYVAYTRHDASGQSLWFVRSDGGLPPVRITPSSYDAITAQWAPTAQTTGGESFYYLAYETTGAIGLRTAGPAQIVVRAFFPATATLSPAIRLPFQSATSAHHLAGWASAMVR